jgi:hypothetical protein
MGMMMRASIDLLHLSFVPEEDGLNSSAVWLIGFFLEMQGDLPPERAARGGAARWSEAPTTSREAGGSADEADRAAAVTRQPH